MRGEGIVCKTIVVGIVACNKLLPGIIGEHGMIEVVVLGLFAGFILMNVNATILAIPFQTLQLMLFQNKVVARELVAP